MGVADLQNKAKDAFRRKQYELAVEMYLEALQFQADDRTSAEGFFQAAKKARETHGKGLFGGMLSKASVGTSRDPAKRMVSCLRGLAKNPTNKGLLMSLGEAAAEASAFETAAVAFKEAAESDPDDNTAWKQLGEMLGRKGRIQEALEALGQAVKLNPKDQEAVKLRKNLAAEGALKLSGFETAKSSRDLIKDQGVARDLEQQAKIQLTPEHALEEIDRVKAEIAKDPQNVRAFVRLSDLHLQRGDEAEAVKAMREALRLDPRNFDLSVRIGDVRLGQLKRDAEAAQAAVRARPGDAALEAKFEDAKRALVEARLEEYGRRVKEHPLDLAERFKLGQTLLLAGRIDEAAGEFQQTVRDPNRKIDSLLNLAKCFEKKNLIGLAVKKIEEAIADFPTLSSPRAKDLHYAYADLLERKGEKEKAREIFEQIFEVDIGFRDVSKRLDSLTTGP